MAYVDGFVVAVPKERLAEYLELATLAGKVWKEHGALAYRESVADDVPVGELTSFPRAVKLEENETVVLSWIVFRSREHRDEVNAKAMKDPRVAHTMDPTKMPFDGKRMIYGGFETKVEM